jgi:hypothetical protein
MPRRRHTSPVEDSEQFKNLPGPLAKDYNEVQMRQLHREMYAMAELLLDLYFGKKKGESPKRQAPRFDTQEPRP